MRLRPALTAAAAAILLAVATPATASDDAANLTLVVTVDGAAQIWSAADVAFGAGPELVGPANAGCAAGGVVDVDPSGRTITVTVARGQSPAEVSLTVATTAIGGLTAVTPGLPGLTLTATPEVAVITWQAAPTADPGCSTATAVFGYVGPGEPVPPVVPPLVEVGTGTATPTRPAAPAAVVVAAPSFAG